MGLSSTTETWTWKPFVSNVQLPFERRLTPETNGQVLHDFWRFWVCAPSTLRLRGTDFVRPIYSPLVLKSRSGGHELQFRKFEVTKTNCIQPPGFETGGLHGLM